MTNFAIALGGSYNHLDPDGDEDDRNGPGNLEVGAKYQFFTNPEHEALLSVGLEAQVGGTGDRDAEAAEHSTISRRCSSARASAICRIRPGSRGRSRSPASSAAMSRPSGGADRAPLPSRGVTRCHGMFRNLIAIAILSLWHPDLWAHAFLERAEPAVGSVSTVVPTEVRLAFGQRPGTCLLRGTCRGPERGRRHDRGDRPGDPNRLAVSIPGLGSGTYRVRWSVVSRDGHQTEGDYPFTIESPRSNSRLGFMTAPRRGLRR